MVINSNIRDGSLRESAAEMGMPLLLYESGEALRFGLPLGRETFGPPPRPGTEPVNGERRPRFATATLIGVAAVCALTLYHGPVLLDFVPKFVLGGVLVYLGLSLLKEWLVDARRNLSSVEYLLVLLILAFISK